MNAHTQGPQVWLYYTQLQGKGATAHEGYDRNRVPVVGQHGGLLPSGQAFGDLKLSGR